MHKSGKTLHVGAINFARASRVVGNSLTLSHFLAGRLLLLSHPLCWEVAVHQ